MVETLILTLLAFVVADYTLGRATVKDPIRIAIAVIFAVLVFVLKAGL